jgi:hypothetical protein
MERLSMEPRYPARNPPAQTQQDAVQCRSSTAKLGSHKHYGDAESLFDVRSRVVSIHHAARWV